MLIQAGYDEDSAHVTASNLQNENKYPLVVGRINELRLEKKLPELTSKQRKFGEYIGSRLTAEQCLIQEIL